MAWIDYRRKTSSGNYSFFGGSSKHRRKHNDEDVANMKQRILNGETYRNVGLDYGLTGGSIYNKIKRHMPIERQSIPKNYMPLKDKSEELGYSVFNVWRHIKTKNLEHIIIGGTMYVPRDLKITNSKFIPEDKIDKIMELYEQGYKRYQIAEMLDIHRLTVGNYIRLLK